MTNRGSQEGTNLHICKHIVGCIIHNEFVAHRNGTKHMFRKVPGWGINLDALEWLEEHGVEDICFIDVETRKVHTATRSNFQNHAALESRKSDTQLCLGLKYWNVQNMQADTVMTVLKKARLVVATAGLAYPSGFLRLERSSFD